MASTTKLPALLLILSILLSTTTPILSCGYCSNPPHKPPKTKSPKPHVSHPTPGTGRPGPITLPPISHRPPTIAPVTPPGTRPPVVPVLPPIVPFLPPGIVPPILPPGTVPGGPNCPPGTPVPSLPPPPAAPTCPIDTLKLGACVDLLGGLVHIIIGDSVVNQCCPLIQGLVELEAALCLCTTIRLKLLNINLYLPLALQLLLTCGKAPPPGFTCSI